MYPSIKKILKILEIRFKILNLVRKCKSYVMRKNVSSTKSFFSYQYSGSNFLVVAD